VGVTAVSLSAGGRPPRHAEAPPTARTGGFGEQTCVECHLEYQLNPPGGRLLLEGAPAEYEAGRTYPLTVVLQSEEMDRAGFEAAARFESGAAAGAQAGVLASVDARVAVTPDSVSRMPYAHHTRAGTHVSDPALATWSLTWTAPASGGDVVFHLAANSANGDDSPLGDLVYTTVVRARASSTR